jgi:large subunit ribosomal protein L29
MPRPIEKFNQMTRDELEHQRRELGEQIFHLRFQLTTGQAEGVTRLRLSRKDLARVNTLLSIQRHGGQTHTASKAAAPKAEAKSEHHAHAKHKAAPKAKAHKAAPKKSAKAGKKK